MVRAALDKHAEDLTVMEVTNLTSYADYFLVAGGASNRQVKAISNAITAEAKELGSEVLGVEGLSSAKWVLIDLGDVVAHIFYAPVRAFYDLEGLWTDAPRVSLPDLLGEDVPAILESAPSADDLD